MTTMNKYSTVMSFFSQFVSQQLQICYKLYEINITTFTCEENSIQTTKIAEN